MKKLILFFNLMAVVCVHLTAQSYGDIVKIRHVLTNTHLHSHAVNYTHTGTSGQQQVTAFSGSDDNDYWIIKRKHGNNRGDGYIRHGDIIRLEHLNTRRNLHSHQGRPSPLSNQQEVTCFGTNGNGDDNDNWRVEVEGGGEWTVLINRVRLIHVNTNTALHSHEGWASPDLTTGQQEVTCYGGRDDNDWWMLTEIKPSGIPKNLAVKLSEIWMGECGNTNNCHHEPVAGLVKCELFNARNSTLIAAVGDNNKIWQAPDHTLVCDNYNAPRELEFDNGEGIGHQPLGTLQFPIDETLLNEGSYRLTIKFNLGVRHQDNPLASVGGHWLARGDNLLEATIYLNAGTIREWTTIGPFQTASDRCHEFWLGFTFGVWDRN